MSLTDTLSEPFLARRDRASNPWHVASPRLAQVTSRLRQVGAARSAASDGLGTALARLERSLGSIATPAELRLEAARVGELARRPPARSRGGSRNLAHRLLLRTSMGWNLPLNELVETIGWRDYLEQQLHPQEVDDHGLEHLLRDALPSLTMTPLERAVTYGDGNEAIPFFHLVIATVLRQLYSPRQLFERMVIFWSDHFNISFFSDFGIFFKPTDDLEVIRRHALGKFPDLLRASARSPAMLDYLTNDSNVKGHPNENYAREVMELHSLGVDGGYTEHDVKELARALTGWGFGGPETGPGFGRFRFSGSDHDRGAKEVLGLSLPAGRGVEDGEDVLALLGRHPATARFVASKLLRYFWGYLPPQRTVDAVAQVYLDTGGGIRSMLRRVLSWFELVEARPKLKRPLHLMISSIRALGGGVSDVFPLLASLLSAGHLPFYWGPPNGYPDSEAYWSGRMLPRWNFAAFLTASSELGVDLDLSWLEQATSAEQLVAVLDFVLLNQTMTDTTRAALESFAGPGRPGTARARETLALALSSPEMQRY